MSSFRVARDRVSVFPQGVLVGVAPEVKRPEPSEQKQVKEPDPRENAAEQARRLRAEAESVLAAAQAEAAEIAGEARAQSEKLIAEAQEGAKQAYADARERGYAEGKQQAYEEGAQRKQQEALEFEHMTAEIRRERDRVIDSLREEIAAVVIEIAKRVINVKLKESDEAFINIINNELTKLKQSETTTVTVSSEDYIRYFIANAEQKSVFESEGVRVLENRSFQPGDCLIETDTEIVDCGIAGQLERVEQMLMEEAAANESDP